MMTLATFVTAVMAFTAALLLLYAGFDVPVIQAQGNLATEETRRERLHAIRKLGAWAAVFAVLGAYVAVFSA